MKVFGAGGAQVFTVGQSNYYRIFALAAGIDGALHVIERQSSRQQAEAVATYMEYDWRH